MTELTFPEFDNIPVSTKTFIVMTNISLKIRELFDSIPITPYIVIPKRRGRKKKVLQADPNEGIPSGSIITLEFEDQIRGVDLKKKKKVKEDEIKKRGNYFRNSVTIVMIIEDKRINFKVSRNGKLQMTGCKNDDHAELVVKYLWKIIMKLDDVHTFIDDSNNFQAIFIPAMRNIDFPLGFYVNREELDSYINEDTDYHSLLETSFGYTGVNIKIPVVDDIRELSLKRMFYNKEQWVEDTVLYQDYLDMLPEKEKEKKLSKKRFNTFLVFHSGKIIMSGICAEFQKETYYHFLDIIRECYDRIEEKLESEVKIPSIVDEENLKCVK
jgi:TATA-box binding protein (TBP) (component of TFIID and TFIIIB)